MIEHVVAFASVLGHNPRAARVVDHVVLDQAVVAAVDRHPPLRRTVHDVADERELIAVGRRRQRSEIVVEVDGVSSDLVRPNPRHVARAVELG